MPPQFLSPEQMNAGQLEKRQRLLEATIRLVDQYGVGNVRVKDASEESGVALGTLYRFFESRDHLFACAYHHWARRLPAREFSASRSRSVNHNDALLAFFEQGTRSFEKHRHLLELLVYISIQPSEVVRDQTDMLRREISEAIESHYDGMNGERAHLVSEFFHAVWWEQLTGWHVGRRTSAQVIERMAYTIEVIGPDSRQGELGALVRLPEFPRV